MDLTASEKQEIFSNERQLTAIVESMARPSNREKSETLAIISVLMALPSPARNGMVGEAALEGYEIGLRPLRTRLLVLAVERALQDPERRFRPSPNELLVYVKDEMAAIRRRRTRLMHFRQFGDVPRLQAPELSDEERARVVEQAEQLVARMVERSGGSQRPRTIKVSDNPTMPTREDYLSWGMTEDEVDKALGGKSNG